METKTVTNNNNNSNKELNTDEKDRQSEKRDVLRKRAKYYKERLKFNLNKINPWSDYYWETEKKLAAIEQQLERLEVGRD